MNKTIDKLFKGLSLKEIEEIVFGDSRVTTQKAAKPVYIHKKKSVNYNKKQIVV